MDSKKKQQRCLPYVYYQAIRNHQPVWKLEDMRTMETFHWNERRRTSFTPAEALLYAIVHDHQAYAQYLLSQYPENALAAPGQYFHHTQASVPHFILAVKYNRREILKLMLHMTHRVPSLRASIGGKFNAEDGKTPLHLACELLHLDIVILLLSNGLAPQSEDQNGVTPLDVILAQLQDTNDNVVLRQRCLDSLLLFIPELRFKMKGSLEEDRDYWTQILGEDTLNYLVGRVPAPLLLITMQKVISLLPSEEVLESLNQLPIPPSLKSLSVPCNMRELSPTALN